MIKWRNYFQEYVLQLYSSANDFVSIILTYKITSWAEKCLQDPLNLLFSYLTLKFQTQCPYYHISNGPLGSTIYEVWPQISHSPSKSIVYWTPTTCQKHVIHLRLVCGQNRPGPAFRVAIGNWVSHMTLSFSLIIQNYTSMVPYTSTLRISDFTFLPKKTHRH